MTKSVPQAKVIRLDGDTLNRLILDAVERIAPRLDEKSASIIFWPNEVGSKCSDGCEVTVGYMEKG